MRPFHMAWFTWYGAQDWTDPSWTPTSWADPDVLGDMARLIEERGLFDTIVFADRTSLSDDYGGTPDVYIKYGLESIMHDPMALCPVLARKTSTIGIIPTLNTSIWPAHLISRSLFTLNRLCGHRLGWNVVTGADDATSANFGLETVPHDRRYDLADEYLNFCHDLWSTWDRRLAGEGGPDSGPVIMQAGGSDRGRDFAALHAQVVITHQNTPAEMKAFRDDIRARADRQGRDPDKCKVFFTVKPVIGVTDADAENERAALVNSPEISVEIGLARYSSRIGADLSVFDVDKPLDQELPSQHAHAKAGKSLSHIRQYYRNGQAPLLRDVAIQEALKETTIVQGSYRTVADRLIEIMEEAGGDGLAIRGALTPRKVIPIVEQLMPELRKKGAVRTAYAGKTLRDHLAQF